VVSADQQWVDRIGPAAAEQLARGAAVRRAGGVMLLLFVALEIAFQLDNYFRPGIIASAVLFFAGMFCLFYSMRYSAQARRMIATRVGLAPDQARFVPVSRGIADYDRWYTARGNPGWPVKGWR
jgi:hypothetical protein